jgi:glycerophosphoryl diester phosphodiesterase
VLNFAHQGGDLEAPSNTLYAFAKAVAKGADAIELDVHASADGELVVIHDALVDRTTDGSGRVDSMSLAELRALDAAHWFVPGAGPVRGAEGDAYVFRAVATGERPAPEGYRAEDFRIPTLREVLERFPDVYVNIDIKGTAPETRPYEAALAGLLREYGRSDDVIVASFVEEALETFKRLAPEVSTAAGRGQAEALWRAMRSGANYDDDADGHHAVQVPITFSGRQVVSASFVEQAHAAGLAVHVWTVDDRPAMEWLLDLGVDGIITSRPGLLDEVLHERRTMPM